MAQKLVIRKAAKSRKKARVAFIGPSGSVKTYTALTLAKALGGKTIVIETEAGTSNIYAIHMKISNSMFWN
jgi:ATP-dependent protease Clp ATPase subunit